jgi:D-serine deaminase-like pyridoxal phosphate-dependent protein
MSTSILHIMATREALVQSPVDRAIRPPKLPPGLDTPVVVIDVDRLAQNLATMQAQQSAAGIRLRPHLKTAKNVAVARQAIALGAVGITVATLGEAEVFAEAGIRDIFVAYPVCATGPKAQRLAALAARCDLQVGIDSAEAVRAIAAAVPATQSGQLGVLVELDSGEGRSGVSPEEVPNLVGLIVSSGLTWRGAFTHGGHSYLGPERVTAAAADEVNTLSAARAAVLSAGYDISEATWSAGSTPTARLSNCPPVTEQRPGTYMFNDRHQAHLGAAPPGTHALVVAVTVVSLPRPGVCILDSGAKSLAKDRAPYVAGHGFISELPNAVITTLYDHHAVVQLHPSDREPAIGQQLSVIPNHVCPVINLTDALVIASEGRVLGTWQVDSRGRH